MKRCLGCMKEYEEYLNQCPHCEYMEDTPPKEAYHMIPGSLLHGKYTVGKVIGYGGFGVTYVGYDVELERKVAIKEYLPAEFSTRIPGQTNVTVYEGDKAEQFESGLDKFVNEAKRLAKFTNLPGIVQIYDSFSENGTAYIVMEYLEGETLKEKIEREGKLSLDDSLNVILPIVSALKEVHKLGIIHRDIAPDNIMVTESGDVKLIDFGASRFATTAHSRSLTVLIKQGYAPTEQYNSRGDQGAWTDVYALAATFYKLLTGITPDDAMERKANDSMKSPAKCGVKISKNTDTAIMNALNVNVEYRTKSMEEFENELLSQKEVIRILEPEHKEDIGKWPLWAKLTTCGVAIAIITFVTLLLTGVIRFGNSKLDEFAVAQGKTYVPNFINQDIDVAQLLASNNKIQIQIIDKRNSDDIAEGMVLLQTPSDATNVSENSIVELVISAGKAQVYVPSLTGLDQSQAMALLDSLGLEYELVEVDSSLAAGGIVEQNFEADEAVDKGTVITLTVSTGKIEDVDTAKEVFAPNLINMNFADAQKLLEGLKLFIVKTTEEYSEDVPSGKIISQSIVEGTSIFEGDTISVVVSLGKRTLFVPDVQYKDESEAKKTLEESGLKVSIKYEDSDIVAKGKVIVQSIEKGSKVDWETKITITVSNGKKEVVVEPTPEPEQTPSQDTASGGNTNTQTPSTPSTPVQPEPEPEPVWSEWSESLPENITEDNYIIATKTQYAYREKYNTSDGTLTNIGYEYISEKNNYSEYGNYSEWSTTEYVSSDTRKVESATQYIYTTWETQTITGNTPTKSGYTTISGPNLVGYGEWSTETTSPPTTVDNVNYDVEITKERVMGSRYRWYQYTYLDSNGWKCFSSYPGAGKTYHSYYSSNDGWTSNWQAPDGYTFFDKNNMAAGIADYDIDSKVDAACKKSLGDGKWDVYYREAQYNIEVSPTYYKYREKINEYTYERTVESSWSSSWQFDKPKNYANLKTRTVYRYSDKKIESVTYTYWTPWSSWNDEVINASDNKQVKTRILYQYIKK